MKRSLLLAGIGLLCLSALGFSATPGRHPEYLHAIQSLRDARWMLEHRPVDRAVTQSETAAIQEVDAALDGLKQAAVEDGKNLHEHEHVEDPSDRVQHLHKAKDFLAEAHHYAAEPEDDPRVRGLQQQILHHIDAAAGLTDRALRESRGHN